MKIVLPGGAGQVGTILARAFHADKHEVVVLSRKSSDKMPWRVVGWDARTIGGWAAEIDVAAVVINLAGRNVNCRYTPENRREIRESRIASTRVVGEAIAQAAHPPRVWLQASTATIYADRYDAPNDEATGIIGGNEPNVPKSWGFSIEVARAWGKTLFEAVTPQTRKVALRAAVVMSPDRGSIFDVLLGLVRRGLGGASGSGKQYVSWIHHADFVRAVQFLIERDELSGSVNLASPDPLPNADFMQAIRAGWGAPFGLPATKWMLEMGAMVLRTETELVLKSRRVVPGRLLDAGFTFDYPDWPTAARNLCEQWRAKAHLPEAVSGA